MANQAQRNEIEALQAFLNGCEDVALRLHDLPESVEACEGSLELDFLVSSKAESDGMDSNQHLKLHLRLPPEYPASAAPCFEISSSFLPDWQLGQLCKGMDRLLTENNHDEILIALLVWVREESWEFLAAANDYASDPSESLDPRVTSWQESSPVTQCVHQGEESEGETCVREESWEFLAAANDYASDSSESLDPRVTSWQESSPVTQCVHQGEESEGENCNQAHYIELQVRLMSGMELCSVSAQDCWKVVEVIKVIETHLESGKAVAELLAGDRLLPRHETLGKLRLESGIELTATLGNRLLQIVWTGPCSAIFENMCHENVRCCVGVYDDNCKGGEGRWHYELQDAGVLLPGDRRNLIVQAAGDERDSIYFNGAKEENFVMNDFGLLVASSTSAEEWLVSLRRGGPATSNSVSNYQEPVAIEISLNTSLDTYRDMLLEDISLAQILSAVHD